MKKMWQVLRSFKCLYSIKWLFFNVSNIFHCNSVFFLFLKERTSVCKTVRCKCQICAKLLVYIVVLIQLPSVCMTLHLLKLSWYGCLWKECSLLPYSMARSVHPCEAPCKIHFKCYHIKGMFECPSSLLWLLFSFSVCFAGAEYFKWFIRPWLVYKKHRTQLQLLSAPFKPGASANQWYSCTKSLVDKSLENTQSFSVLIHLNSTQEIIFLPCRSRKFSPKKIWTSVWLNHCVGVTTVQLQQAAWQRQKRSSLAYELAQILLIFCSLKLEDEWVI